MKILNQLKKKSPLFLIIGILILCAGFIFISCGKKPKAKVQPPDKGAFALDFTDCPGELCKVLLETKDILNDPEIVADTPLTIEAWIKSKAIDTPEIPTLPTPTPATSTFTGGILANFDTGGMVLYVKEGIAKAAIRRIAATGTATATADYIVSSFTLLLRDVWHHIAGVLADDGPHAHPTSTTCTATAANDIIHLDIYVDGRHEGCARTFGVVGDPATGPSFAEAPFNPTIAVGLVSSGLETIDGISSSDPFPGIIDETRLWIVGRTQDEIIECMSRELDLSSGTCGRNTFDLLGNFRFNEGEGAQAFDWTGLGAGVKESIKEQSKGPKLLQDWTTGWTQDTPSLIRAD